MTLIATTPIPFGVFGPASSVDNELARFDGVSGKVLQGTGVAVDDNGSVDLPAGQSVTINGQPIPWTQISKSGSSLADLATRSAGDLSSGNLPIARMPISGSWNITDDLITAGPAGGKKITNTSRPVGTAGGSGVKITDAGVLICGSDSIGTTEPGKTLDVNGDIRVRGDAGSINFYRDTSPTDIARIKYDNVIAGLEFWARNKSINFSTNDSDDDDPFLFIKGTTGEVGIGTNTPTLGKLQIDDVSGGGNVVLALNEPHADRRIEFVTPTQAGLAGEIRTAGTSNGLLLKSSSGGNQLFLKDNGDVGFGTDSPGLSSLNTTLTVSSVQSGSTRPAIEMQGFNGNSGGTIGRLAWFNKAIGAVAYINVERGSGGDDEASLDFYTKATGNGITRAMRIDKTGNVGMMTTSPTAGLDMNFDLFRLRTAKTPASAGAAGNQGDTCWDSDYLYTCVSTNTWKRTALSTW